jgi:hypothetical protein
MPFRHTETLQPEQLAFLKAMFDEITSQPWFDQSSTAKETFAKYLIESFPTDRFDARRYRFVVETSARMFYAREDDTGR